MLKTIESLLKLFHWRSNNIINWNQPVLHGAGDNRPQTPSLQEYLSSSSASFNCGGGGTGGGGDGKRETHADVQLKPPALAEFALVRIVCQVTTVAMDNTVHSRFQGLVAR